MRPHSRLLLIGAALLSFQCFGPGLAHAASTCDLTEGSSDQIALRAAWDRIDLDCPCALAASKGDYRSCAKDSVEASVNDDSLPSDCRREARDYAKKSRCGTEGAVSCCRIDTSGREKHRVLRKAEACVDSSRYTACVSQVHSLVAGCDATGCLALCGNGESDPGEECDTPGTATCDESCQSRECGNGVVEGDECEPPGTTTCSLDCQVCESSTPAGCGNLVIDDGETCDPPSVGSCSSTCQTAPCSAALAGEIDVSCVGATSSSLAAVGGTSGYLLAWTGDGLLARRFDANGAALDASATDVGDQVKCGEGMSSPAAAFDGSSYYVAWLGFYFYPPTGPIYQTMHGRKLGALSGAGAMDTMFEGPLVGFCRASTSGPTTASAPSDSLFAIGWQTLFQCGGGSPIRNPNGELVDLDPSFSEQASITGYPLMPGAAVSSGGASVASLAGATLWVWNAAATTEFISAAWTDGTTTGDPFSLSSAQGLSQNRRPAVAAGTDSFLVAWRESSDSTPPREIRAVRVSRSGGRLDADGGMLLATLPAALDESPAVAFDGNRWLVAWVEQTSGVNELRAVAVAQDGTVIDASPRLIASGVEDREPVLASAGNGKVLVLYTRDEGTHTAVRAQLVTP